MHPNLQSLWSLLTPDYLVCYFSAASIIQKPTFWHYSKPLILKFCSQTKVNFFPSLELYALKVITSGQPGEWSLLGHA